MLSLWQTAMEHWHHAAAKKGSFLAPVATWLLSAGQLSMGAPPKSHTYTRCVMASSASQAWYHKAPTMPMTMTLPKWCETVWQWTIISQSIEQAFPDLPSFIQQALNTTQAVSQGQGECEVMLSIATHYCNQRMSNAEPDPQKAIDMAGMSKPDCHQYLPTLGYYVKHYGGGDGFPILHLLQHTSILSSFVFHMQQNWYLWHVPRSSFPNTCACHTIEWGKQFSTTLKIGEEVFSHIAYLDFKEKTTSFPWLRAAMLCRNLSATKVVDGFGKCLTKFDCDRFRSKDLRPQVLQAEQMLALNWGLVQKQPCKDQPSGDNLMGRCMVRVALHLSKKEAKGRDTDQYEDLGEVATKFSEGLVEVTSATMLAPAATTESQDAQKVETLEAGLWHFV